MVTVILYIAISADGFIADKDGGVSWLDEYAEGDQDCGYQDFYNSIDALVYGKNTYEQVLTFSPWPYPDKKSYVFTDNDRLDKAHNVEFVQGDILQCMKDIEAQGVKRLWLMGGAQLAKSFYQLGLIDEYQFFIMPKNIEQGIALPEQIWQAYDMKLVDEKQWFSGAVAGIVRKIYKRISDI